MAEEYIYAVARVHSVEQRLLGSNDTEQLLSCRSYDEALRYLSDKGYGDGASFDNYEQLLAFETEKTWSFISELIDEPGLFDVFRYNADFHNVKASVKAAYSSVTPERVFIYSGTIEPERIYDAVKSENFDILPQHIAEPARMAYNMLTQTGDGQLCDILLDCASLNAIRDAGSMKKCKNEFIHGYAELYVALTDIKIAVRANKTKKSDDFLTSALAQCDAFSVSELSSAALSYDRLLGFLTDKGFGDVSDALSVSLSEFEKVCDNRIMEYIRLQRTNCFTLAPVAAYILARENEIKTVRLILAAKLNHLDDDAVRSRLRRTYV